MSEVLMKSSKFLRLNEAVSVLFDTDIVSYVKSVVVEHSDEYGAGIAKDGEGVITVLDTKTCLRWGSDFNKLDGESLSKDNTYISLKVISWHDLRIDITCNTTKGNGTVLLSGVSYMNLKSAKTKLQELFDISDILIEPTEEDYERIEYKAKSEYFAKEEKESKKKSTSKIKVEKVLKEISINDLTTSLLEIPESMNNNNAYETLDWYFKEFKQCK